MIGRLGLIFRTLPGRTSGDLPACFHKSICLRTSWPSWWARSGVQLGQGIDGVGSSDAPVVVETGEGIAADINAGGERRSAAGGTDIYEVLQPEATRIWSPDQEGNRRPQRLPLAISVLVWTLRARQSPGQPAQVEMQTRPRKRPTGTPNDLA